LGEFVSQRVDVVSYLFEKMCVGFWVQGRERGVCCCRGLCRGLQLVLVDHRVARLQRFVSCCIVTVYYTTSAGDALASDDRLALQFLRHIISYTFWARGT